MKFVENKDISYAKIKKPSCKTLILFTISLETYLLQTVILKGIHFKTAIKTNAIWF
jgi:phage FluMu protein Com